MSEQSMVDPSRPDQEDVLQTVLEDLAKATDERMYFKAQARKLLRRAEQAEMAIAALQARIDQLEAADGESIGVEGLQEEMQ